MDIRELYGDSSSTPYGNDDDDEEEEEEELSPYDVHLLSAYTPAELRTFHCDRVRKMPLSGLDPSMLIGFVVRSEEEWRDLRTRIGEMGKRCKTIFSVQDEPPNWPSDSDDHMGLESISEPDDAIIALSDDDDDNELGAKAKTNKSSSDDEEEFFDTHSEGRSASASLSSASVPGSSKSNRSTEEDAEGPITPGPGTRLLTPIAILPKELHYATEGMGNWDPVFKLPKSWQ